MLKEQNKAALSRLAEAIREADAVLVGAGTGISQTAAINTSRSIQETIFPDFQEKYHFPTLEKAAGYGYETPEEQFAFWSRYIYLARYQKNETSVYRDLHKLLEGRPWFVLTTNDDAGFQRGDYEPEKVFETHGDLGRWQCAGPCCNETFSNKEEILRMLRMQKFTLSSSGSSDADGNDREGGLIPPNPREGSLSRSVPADALPACPRCGGPLRVYRRSMRSFVQDEHYEKAAAAYLAFVESYRQKKLLLLEIGAEYRTQDIIKYPFWELTSRNERAVYACINSQEAIAPDHIEHQSICINGDEAEILHELMEVMQN